MKATQILKRSNEDNVEGRRICSLSWFRETKQASDWNFCRRVGSWSKSVVVEWFFDVKLVRLWEQIRRNASFRCRLYYCQLLCIAWCVCAIKDGGISNAKKKTTKYSEKTNAGAIAKKRYRLPKHFNFHLHLTSYEKHSEALLPGGFSSQHCLQSLCQHAAQILLISVTQRRECSTTQPAGYWTCEAFPCSEDLSHKQSLKTARDWLALGVIDCWNQSHKNDCIGSRVSESINYGAVPADLNISSSTSASLIPQPRRGIYDRWVAN